MTFRFRTFGAAALVAGSLYAMPAFAETVLNAVMQAPLRTLDPILSTAQIVRTHGFMVFDTLLGMDAKYNPQPQMADYAVSPDKLTYTFTLRDGLKWHDGTPVKAEDCVASLKRWAANDGAGRTMMTYVASIEATSDKVLVIKLSKPFGQVLELLAKPSPVPPFMMPKRLAETPAGKQVTEMIGSGPFKFVADQYRPGDQAVYVKNPDYKPRSEPMSWTAGGKVVNVDKVVWKAMPDMQTSINALQSGDVDLIEQVTIDLLPLLKANDEIKTGAINALGSQVTGRFNHRLPPFDNLKVRQAAMYALDQEQLMQTAIGDSQYYKLCASVYGCDVPLASDAGAEYLKGSAKERMAKAKELLKASGYDGTPVLMMQPTDLTILSTQPIVAAERLREAGFKVDVASMDWATLQSRKNGWQPVAQGGWNMFFTYWGVAGIWNPTVHALLDGSGKDSAWAGWPKDARIEELRNAYLSAATTDEQKKIAREIQQIAYDQGFYFNAGEFQSVAAWSAKLKNLQLGPLTLFWGVSK
ncbi:ABC transporter substrate-binding protein [Bosea sp. (in: a-proteobacteria)]|uniref:ABC transporter substrate-binding protein n=1 Tax=Bosea sp. (in: a-proteobacteria) TaxID=1871050 RepID=UPI001AD2B784|nr:ABC transporter substrate-binding protein [Bosea sp. (in: a-proteobacteria)]MBN9443711.1 ABC transporter substrate-binding protein [Bosea sp. (in: a-proteobacteria)]